MARPDVDASATCSASRSRSRASPSSSRRSSWGSTSTAGAACRRARTCYTLVPMIVAGRVRHVLRARRQRLDERPVRVHASQPDGTSPTSTRWRRCSTGAVWQQFIHMFVACYLVTGFLVGRGLRHGHVASAAATSTTVSASRCRSRSPASPPLAAAHRPLRRHAPVLRPAEQVGGDGARHDRRGAAPRCISAGSSSTARRGSDPDPAARFAAVAQWRSTASCPGSTSSRPRTDHRRRSSTCRSRRWSAPAC